MTPSRWRRVAAPAALLLTAGLVSALAGVSSPASADDSTTVTVVGTSDVYDSGLVQDIIKPGFEAAYPGLTLNYVSRGTGAAIAYAEAGTASALLVHAATLENQFVANGYSGDGYGRAIFWGDYVLVGPANDPAGVLNGADHDIVGAFSKIAAAGAAGTANFVSRGGTPGTTVQEHYIWSLTHGVTSCTVSDANGGGTSPSTASGACPAAIPYPSWYHATGLTQGPNVLNGNTCNYAGGGCYVFTDRGTFAYLQSIGQATNLKIVTRDNTVAGQTDLLVNSFHAYAVSAAKFASNPNVAINTQGAQDFLTWITSSQGQALIGSYLNRSGDAPFLPSAAPTITTTGTLPATVDPGDAVTVRGVLANAVPGTPVLDSVPVKLLAKAPGGQPFQVAHATTDATGGFTLSYHPKANRVYYVATDAISKIERPDLSPVFGDQLAPATLKVGKVQVQGAVTIKRAQAQKRGHLRLVGHVSPKVTRTPAKLVLYVARPGHKLTLFARRTLGVGSRHFDQRFHLGKGTWKYKLQYSHPGVVLQSATTPDRIKLS